MPVVPRPVLEFDGGYLRDRGGTAIPYNPNPITPPPPPPPPAGGAKYRPIPLTWNSGLSSAAQITALNAQGLDIPTSATLVLWPYSNPDGALLNVWIESLATNQIGVLPEATHPDGSDWPYLFETANGFKRTATYVFTMMIPRQGILGLGPKAIIAPKASSYSSPPQPDPRPGGAGVIDPLDGSEKVGCVNSVMRTTHAEAYFGNFEMRGKSYGGIAYSGISCNTGLYCVENIFFNAAHRGFKNSPNGEAGALTTQKGTFPTVRLFRNCEIECRDATGARVGSSPWMLNNGTGCDIRDIYAHHSVAGMPTAYNFKSTVAFPMKYARIRSEYNGAAVNGSCHNWELISTEAGAPVEFVGPGVLICNWHGNADATQGTLNTGLHMSGGSNQARATINVRNYAIDKGPRPRTGPGTPQTDANGLHVLSVQLFGYTTGLGQQGLDIHYFAPSGAEITVFTA